MTYREFTIDTVGDLLGLTLGVSPLFAGLGPVPPPAWVPASIGSVSPDMLINEKSRSEFLVAPVLRAAKQVRGEIGLYSGYILNIDPAKGLAGECDFIFGLGPTLPKLTVPAVSIVEVKRDQVDDGLGQAIAQMRGLQIFNDRAGVKRPIWGVATSGEAWRFLLLDADAVTLDPSARYLTELGSVFACLLEMLKPFPPVTATPAP